MNGYHVYYDVSDMKIKGNEYLKKKGKFNLQNRKGIHRKGLIRSLIIAGSFFLLTACGKSEDTIKEEQTKESIIDIVKEYKGYEREILQEEYDFYSYFVERDVSENLSQQELEEKVKAYANEVNAVFYLANKWNLCEPYSYEVLKMRKDQENEIRKMKKEKGEAVYGLEQFSLEQFFQYRLDTAEADLRSCLEEQADAWVVEQAKQYYEENKESFRFREEIEYEVKTKDKTEVLTADRTVLNLLANSDGALADFLESGEENQRYEDISNQGQREVVIKKIIYNEVGFEENMETAVMVYINQKLYQELISMVAENNPVSFRLK